MMFEYNAGGKKDNAAYWLWLGNHSHISLVPVGAASSRDFD
jgi:hypothetical protein